MYTFEIHFIYVNYWSRQKLAPRDLGKTDFTQNDL